MIRAAVLGAAHPHVRYAIDSIAARDDVELVAVAEPDPALRARFLGDVRAPSYASHRELLHRHEVDVAVIAGVYADRGRAILDALAAGARILADKPLCTSPDDLDAIAEAASAAGRFVSIMFEKRFDPITAAARRLLDEGALGTLAMIASTGPHRLAPAARPAWFFDPERYGSIAVDLPVHDIDLVLDLTAASSGSVSAVSGNTARHERPGFDDHVSLLLVAGSVPATIEASWLHPDGAPAAGHYRMRLTGSRGTAELDWSRGELTVTTNDRGPWHPEPVPGRGPADDAFDAVAAGREPRVGTAAALLASRVALLAGESAMRGGETLRWTA